jgi:Family of unknown function (DUF6283)
MSRARITRTRMAGRNHAVHTIEGGRADTYRRTPCPGCPWRTANDGSFPPSAFIHSAETAWDQAMHTFACHETGAEKPALCAGAVLGQPHNIGLRLAYARGALGDDVTDGGAELHADYHAMAVANGCDPNHPRLRRVRRHGH